MNVFVAVLLGLVQGIGEFLPISSSAHLILVPYLLNVPGNTLAFDVSLHLGTSIAVIIMFFQDYLNLLNGVYRKVIKKENNKENNLFWYLVVATIPAATLGLLLEPLVEEVFRNNISFIAFFLAVMGCIIYFVDKYAEKKYKSQEKTIDKLTLKETFIIGASQVIAIFPGFSRSGTTMVTGRLLGASREATAKFSFLLSVPIILGAGLLKLPDIMQEFNSYMLIGIVTSALFGIISIKFLLSYLKKHDFKVFAFYRIIIALLVFLKIILF